MVKELNVIDKLLHKVDPSSKEELALRRKNISCDLWRNLNLKENIICQKSRIRWLKERDLNTKFFPSYLKERRMSNTIVFVRKEGEVGLRM